MDKAKQAELINHLETHIEGWRQFHQFLGQARGRSFNADDESQFLEVKSNLIQQLETILNFIASGGPDRGDIHDLLSHAPSIRQIAELPENSQRGLEQRWHKIFLNWQTVLGQVKSAGRKLGVADLILLLENHLESWKQFHQYLGLARSGGVADEDEAQFLEVKSVLTQEMETILGAIESGGPDRLELQDLIANAPSIGYLHGLAENSRRNLEALWHKAFVNWQSVLGRLKFSQRKVGLDELILQLENHLECWKQFNHFVSLSRTPGFTPEDEQQFLEVKSNLVQELEVILGTIETGAPPRGEIHELVVDAPSIRFLSELKEGSIRALESQWHDVYLKWQAILGQLKVQQRNQPKKGFLARMFGRK